VNVEQASKRVMRKPTPLNLEEGRRHCEENDKCNQWFRRGNDAMDGMALSALMLTPRRNLTVS